MNPFVSVARKISLHDRVSTAPTGIVPLGKLHSATVFVDATELDCAACVAAVHKYFATLKIETKVYAINIGEFCHVTAKDGAIMLDKKCLGLSGAVRKGKKVPVVDGEEQLFINLAAVQHFAIEHAARCSKALFKIGREQLDGLVYDLVITGSEGKTQEAVFKAITGILEKIQ